MIAWLIDWLTDRSIDWEIDWCCKVGCIWRGRTQWYVEHTCFWNAFRVTFIWKWEHMTVWTNIQFIVRLWIMETPDVPTPLQRNPKNTSSTYFGTKTLNTLLWSEISVLTDTCTVKHVEEARNLQYQPACLSNNFISYYSGCRRFDSRLCHWIFFSSIIIPWYVPARLVRCPRCLTTNQKVASSIPDTSKI